MILAKIWTCLNFCVFKCFWYQNRLQSYQKDNPTHYKPYQTFKLLIKPFLNRKKTQKMDFFPKIPNRKSWDTSQNCPRGHMEYLAGSECLWQKKIQHLLNAQCVLIYLWVFVQHSILCHLSFWCEIFTIHPKIRKQHLV